jgi:ankyrin repeat protein
MAVTQATSEERQRETWRNRTLVICLTVALIMLMPQPVGANPLTLEQKLFVAVRAVNPVEVADLLNQGANPNFQTKERSVLDEALIFQADHTNQIRNKAVIVKLLLKAGANPNTPSGSWNRTPLMTAAGITTALWYSEGHPLLISTLLDAGADPNTVSTFLNSTALHFAADYGKVENMRALIAGGAKPDVQDSLGNTALTRVLLFHEDLTEQQVLEAVKLLLSAGASVRHCNNDEEHPAGFAARTGMPRVADLLFQALEKNGPFRCGR